MLPTFKKYAGLCIILILVIGSFEVFFAFSNPNSFSSVQAATTETSINGEFGELNNWSSVRGSWSISNGILTGLASTDNWALIHGGDTSWTNYQVTVKTVSYT